MLHMLDTDTASYWESTWLAECDRRVERYESGEDRGIPPDQALPHARQRLLMRASACGEAGTPAGGGGCRTG